MSAFGGKAEVIQGVANCPLIAKSRLAGCRRKRTTLAAAIGGARQFNVFSQSMTVDTELSAVSLWLPLIITKRFLGLPTILS